MNGVSFTIVLGFAIALMSCSNGQLPIGAKMEVVPANKSFYLGAFDSKSTLICSNNSDAVYQDVPVNISITDAQGSPLGGVDVGIYAEFSGNSFSGPEVLQVFADRNGNGVIDQKTELVSGRESEIFKTRTNRYDGTAMVFVRMNLSCPYSGELYIFSDAGSRQIKFEVTYSVD